MKELDVKKIYSDNLTSVGELTAQLTITQSKLLSAIIIMQFVIENPDDTEVNLRSMQKFVDQFTKS
jgi:uncharacterized integral membrane protein